MKKRIGCLHAHYSNIEYIQSAIASEELECIHFVDPGLMSRITAADLDAEKVKEKVVDQMEWIAQTNVDAILITCTNYIAMLDENRLQTSIPIVKIDEPFFSYVCGISEPQVLLFTNPATVEGTMRRLHEFAAARHKSVNNVEARVIENTFELIMKGEKDLYVAAVANYMKEIVAAEKGKAISVAQLSMVDSAVMVEKELNVAIGNPLNVLRPELARRLAGPAAKLS